MAMLPIEPTTAAEAAIALKSFILLLEKFSVHQLKPLPTVHTTPVVREHQRPYVMIFEPSLHLMFSSKFVSPIENFFAKVMHLLGAAFAEVGTKKGNKTIGARISRRLI